MNIIYSKLHVRLTLLEEALGTASNDPDLHGTYIASKAPDAPSMEEEIAAIGKDAVEERGITVFPKDNGVPFIYDYQIKGFFKDSCAALRKAPGTVAASVKAYKKEIDGLLFVQDRKNLFVLPEGAQIGECQRPLRASTPQGEITAIAHSETVPAGSTVECTILCLTAQIDKLVRELLDYGVLRGIGQWRNSGKGRFTWELLDCEKKKCT